MKGPGTRDVENTELHLGFVDAGAGPSTILLGSDEYRMNHDYLLGKYVHLADVTPPVVG